MTKEPKDGSDEGRYTKKHKKTVLDELRKDGVILELNAYQKFIEQEWDTELNPRFSRINRELSWKERVNEFGNHISRRVDDNIGEIDLVVEKHSRPVCDPFRGSNLSLVVECKTRLDMNWVLLLKESALYEQKDADFGSLSVHSSSVFTYLRHEYAKDFDFWGNEIHQKFGHPSHHSISNLPIIAQTGWGLFKNRNSLYDAVKHVLDAFDYQVITHCFHTELDLHRIQKGSKTLRHWRSYPVVIFDGSLWGLSLEEGEPDIKPIEHAVMEFTHHNQGYYVDIVQWHAIDAFIDKLQKEVDGLNNIHS